jgi:hypothetical protein
MFLAEVADVNVAAAGELRDEELVLLGFCLVSSPFKMK